MREVEPSNRDQTTSELSRSSKTTCGSDAMPEALEIVLRDRSCRPRAAARPG